jgi:hypothetical protein
MMPEDNHFIEQFFDSSIYKEILARNDKAKRYVVRTNTETVFALDANSNTCIELHFPEEIEEAIKTIND